MELPAKYKDLTRAQIVSVRSEYTRLQKGMCMFCGAPLGSPPTDKVLGMKINLDSFPPNFLKYPVHLQHCHKSGYTEGAVHSRCNAVLWQYHGR
jgi:hypothetical protein